MESKCKISNLPSKFTPLGESKALAELQNQKNAKQWRRAATTPLGVPIKSIGISKKKQKIQQVLLVESWDSLTTVTDNDVIWKRLNSFFSNGVMFVSSLHCDVFQKTKKKKTHFLLSMLESHSPKNLVADRVGGGKNKERRTCFSAV